jgi:hypothetical protein
MLACVAQVIAHVVIGLKTVKGTKQLKLDPTIYDRRALAHPAYSACGLALPQQITWCLLCVCRLVFSLLKEE